MLPGAGKGLDSPGKRGGFTVTVPSKTRFRGVAIMFVTNVIVTIGLVMIAPLLPIFAQRAGASGAWMGALFAVDMVARTIAMPLCGRASDRLGRRPFLLTGLVLFIVAALGFTIASDRITLLIIRTVQGIGAGMVIPVLMAYFGEFASSRREAFTMGTLNISFFGGLALGPFIGGLLESRFSLEAPFYFLATAGVLIGLVILFFMPESATSGGGPRGDGTVQAQPSPIWKELVSRKPLRRLCGHRFLVSFGISTAWAFVPLYAVGTLKLSTYDAGIAVGAVAFFTAVIMSPGGYIADHLNRWLLMAAGTFLLAVCLSAMTWAPGFWTLAAVCGTMGLAQGFYMPAGYALMVGQGREMGMGATLGLYSTSLTLGLAVGPLVSGILVDELGLPATFIISGVVAFLASIVVVRGSSGSREGKSAISAG